MILKLLSSKKFVAALLGVISAVAIELGIPETTAAEMSVLLSPLLVYIGAQGVADIGKERVREERTNDPVA